MAALVPADIPFNAATIEFDNGNGNVLRAVETRVQSTISQQFLEIVEERMMDYKLLDSKLEAYKKSLDSNYDIKLDNIPINENLQKVLDLRNELSQYKPSDIIRYSNKIDNDIKDIQTELDNHILFSNMFDKKIKKYNQDEQIFTEFRNNVEQEKLIITQKLEKLISELKTNQEILKQIVSLYKDHDTTTNNTKCNICLERYIELIFECGHCCCSECRKGINKCHLCRREIKKQINFIN